MFFTQLGTGIAGIGLLISVTLVAFAVFEPGAFQYGISSGRVIDLGIYTGFACLALGVLCEISKHLSN